MNGDFWVTLTVLGSSLIGVVAGGAWYMAGLNSQVRQLRRDVDNDKAGRKAFADAVLELRFLRTDVEALGKRQDENHQLLMLLVGKEVAE